MRPTELGIIAPIAVVMLPEALAFVAKLQHLNGKRDGCFYKAEKNPLQKTTKKCQLFL